MPTVIVVHSFRRGTGKTSLVANLAALLARAGKRVGLVDLNIESPSLHYAFGLKDSAITCYLNDVLRQACSVEQATYDVTTSLQGSAPGKLYLLPASTRFLDISMALKGDFDSEALDACIPELIENNQLDIVLVDTRAGLTDDTLAAIAMTDILCIILRPDAQDFQGTAVTVDLARRLGGEVTVSQVQAEFRIPNAMALGALERLCGRGECQREQRKDIDAYLFKGVMPAKAIKRCPYCGSEFAVKSAMRQCPNCGANLEITKE